MEIKERVTKSGPEAGQVYFMVEVDGTVLASRDKRAVEAFSNDPNSVNITREYNNWRWIELREGREAPQNTLRTNKDDVGTLIARVLASLTPTERAELKRLL